MSSNFQSAAKAASDLEGPEKRLRLPGSHHWKIALGLTIAAVLATSAAFKGSGLANSLGEPVDGAADAELALKRDRQRLIADLTVDDEAQILVGGQNAQVRNAAIPVRYAPTETVRPFAISQGAAEVRNTALKCLTQAVYYEAAFEPLQGRRAVAQVVLNRVRHPAYPSSVCGVVYQGSERRTGCQFSFTCDGALLRPPVPGPWREAQRVAEAALTGYVEQSVGTATHYHADYVLPKWAFQLGKIGQLGRHIFYRFPGHWGRSAAFAGQYSGIERVPALDFGRLRLRLAMDQSQAADAASAPGLSVPPHPSDRHAANDVGGRLDVTKPWRLSIPDPTQASSRYHAALEGTSAADRTGSHIALAEPSRPDAPQ